MWRYHMLRVAPTVLARELGIAPTHTIDTLKGQYPLLVVIAAVLIALAGLVTKLAPLAGPLRVVGRLLSAMFPRWNGVERRRAADRRTLATAVLNRLNALADDSRWDDRRFTELEAEVELEGDVWYLRWWGRPAARHVSLSRERSLTRALERSAERVVVLEGEPGSGKSVALLHVALRTAKRAARSRSVKTPIPLYIDLKGFRPTGQVDPDVVYEYVRGTLQQPGFRDRAVAKIVDDEFDQSLSSGGLLLLFDGFDEIPAVLGAGESNTTIVEYAQAIIGFVTVRGCRAVIASREFRGPQSFSLPRFRVLRLGPKQQVKLIKRSGLEAGYQQQVVAGIGDDAPGLRQMTDNPLFLWLLCDYVRWNNGAFPQNVHSVFASYVDHRFESDRQRIEDRFTLLPAQLRSFAEEIGFCIAAKTELGLSPTRDDLRAALGELGRVDLQYFDAAIGAMLHLRLARADSSIGDPAERRFSFMHRRLQEYFAACVVLNDPGRVTAETMLADARWRETAVTILQLGAPASVERLLGAMEQSLAGATAPARAQGTATVQKPEPTKAFSWPQGVLYLLELLAAGLGRSPDRIPRGVRILANAHISAAWRMGRRHDRLWTIEVSTVALASTTTRIMIGAFNSASGLLRMAAYRQATSLAELPEEIRVGIRKTLYALWADGRMRREAATIRAQLSRLPDSGELLDAYRLLRFVSAYDVLALLCVILLRVLEGDSWPSIVQCLGFALAAHIMFIARVRLDIDLSGSSENSSMYLRKVKLILPKDRDIFLGPFLFMRFGCIAIVILRSMGLYELLCAFFIAAIFLTWPDSVISSLRKGEENSWRKWPKAGPRVILRKLDLLRPIGFAQLMSGVEEFLFGVGMLALIGLGLIYFRIEMAVVSVVLAISVLLFVAMSSVRSIMRYVASNRAVQNLEDRTGPYSAQELLDLLREAGNGSKSLALLMSNPRASQNLYSDDALELMADIVTYAERFQSDKSMDSPPGLLSRWRREDFSSFLDFIYDLDEEMLDEITRLIALRQKPRELPTVRSA